MFIHNYPKFMLKGLGDSSPSLYIIILSIYSSFLDHLTIYYQSLRIVLTSIFKLRLLIIVIQPPPIESDGTLIFEWLVKIYSYEDGTLLVTSYP